VVVLDLSLARCAWRALRRSRERFDFWRWLWSYRRRSRPLVVAAIAANAPMAELHVLHTPADIERFIDLVARSCEPPPETHRARRLRPASKPTLSSVPRAA
jgi:hypothetical protein